jgi:hypothetical protein
VCILILVFWSLACPLCCVFGVEDIWSRGYLEVRISGIEDIWSQGCLASRISELEYVLCRTLASNIHEKSSQAGQQRGRGGEFNSKKSVWILDSLSVSRGRGTRSRRKERMERFTRTGIERNREQRERKRTSPSSL